MEVRLFQVGGHEYVFRFGVFRKTPERKETFCDVTKTCPEEVMPQQPLNYIGGKKGVNGGRKVNVETPTNKYAYSRRNISSNLGLDRYKKIKAKMPEILELISKEPERTREVTNRIQKAGLLSFEIKAHMLNMFARICDGISFEDIRGSLWTIISEGWGQDSTIRKQEVL